MADVLWDMPKGAIDGDMTMVELDSEISASLAAFPPGAISLDNLTEARTFSVISPLRLSDGVERTDHVVPGDPEVIVRIYRPRGLDGPFPCLYSIHGGGYIMGSYTMDDLRFDGWCPRFGCVGVSIEYRLSPETPYPGPLDDCYLGLKWVHDHHEELGVDPDRIGITGASAGGGLAAAVAHLARDRGEVPLQYQLLDSPMLDDRQITPSSRLDGLSIWTRESNTFGWKAYLGDLYGTDRVPAYAAAARSEDLAGLPPAYVCVGAADGFRDEDITYAMRLNQAEVPAELHVFPGAPHGVMLFTETAVAQRYTHALDDWLGRQLGVGS